MPWCAWHLRAGAADRLPEDAPAPPAELVGQRNARQMQTSGEPLSWPQTFFYGPLQKKGPPHDEETP